MRGHQGSSPLTRGKPSAARRPAMTAGLIPAHAGKTVGCALSLVVSAAHPRSRGENRFAGYIKRTAKGSSPLTRGKRGFGDLAGRVTRLIPAHAGKTTSTSASLQTSRAHPRSRGENFVDGERDVRVLGSSPLTRGKLPGMLHLVAVAGLIPAHAGKTDGSRQSVFIRAAHPRSRGENGLGGYQS